MTELILKGIDPSVLTDYVKKSARVDDNLPLYIFGDKMVSLKEDLSKTTIKFWKVDLKDLIENHEEVMEQIGDGVCRVSLFSCKQFVTGGLKLFKEKVDLKFRLNPNGDACEFITMLNKKVNIRFSVADASTTFKKLSGGWESVYDFFNTEDEKTTASFTLSLDELKQVKTTVKLESILDKKHEFVTLRTKNGFLEVSTHSADIKLHETDLSLDNVKIKNDIIASLCDEGYNVFVKTFMNVPLIIFKSVDTFTMQSISILTDFNTNIDLDQVEEEIEKTDFSTWDGFSDEPLF